MAYHGISTCYQEDLAWFGGIVCTDGAGSSRSGPYADYSDAALVACHQKEQMRAADIGQYSFVECLNHGSATLKDPNAARPASLSSKTGSSKPSPKFAIPTTPPTSTPPMSRFVKPRSKPTPLPPHARPRKLYVREVWRDLDWLNDNEKIASMPARTLRSPTNSTPVLIHKSQAAKTTIRRLSGGRRPTPPSANLTIPTALSASPPSTSARP